MLIYPFYRKSAHFVMDPGAVPFPCFGSAVLNVLFMLFTAEPGLISAIPPLRSSFPERLEIL